MVATAMTVEYGTFHHLSSLDEIYEACLCSSLNSYKNNWTLCKLWHSLEQLHKYKLASSRLYASQKLMISSLLEEIFDFMFLY